MFVVLVDVEEFFRAGEVCEEPRKFDEGMQGSRVRFACAFKVIFANQVVLECYYCI